MSLDESYTEKIPFGELGLIALESSRTIGNRVNDYIVDWRTDREHKHDSDAAFTSYKKDSYLVDCVCPRFGSGEAKGIIKESVRGMDLYILVDVCNYNLTYSVCGFENHMSPDDNYQDLKRIIGASIAKAHRVNVIMPFLYESRQHKRDKRESLDCAMALEELVNMGVQNIITFDAHDPRVQNAIPLNGFDSFMPTYAFLKAILKKFPDLKIDKDNMMVISPDEGAMGRSIFLANNLGVDMGMFYKRRDYSKVVNGRNPIVAHEFLGASVEGKTVIIVDDMISSGYSVLDVARTLKAKKAKRVFVCVSFGLFTNGLEEFDKAYEDGVIDRVFTTNLVYQSEELQKRKWHADVRMGKFLALIIDSLNHDYTISDLLNPIDRINKLLKKYRERTMGNVQ